MLHEPPPHIGKRTIVVSLSGGSGSAVALLKARAAYPHNPLIGLFADTLTEDDDLYRFLGDLKAATGVETVRLTQGMDIWDCFEHYGAMRVNGACKASVELKIKPIVSWVTDQFTPATAVVASGMSWMEPERQERMDERWKPFRVIHPLNFAPRLTDCQEQDYLRQHGLTPPALYDKNYPHNNCGGGCILAGMGQWAGLLRDFPERFAYHERREQEFYKRTGFTVLRDRRGGSVKPMTLETLRERVEAGETFRDFRSACNCMGAANDETESAVREELDSCI